MNTDCILDQKPVSNKEFIESLKIKLWILAALVLGAAEPIIVKYSYLGGLEPIRFYLVRNIVGGLVLLPIFFYFHSRQPLHRSMFMRILPIAILLTTTNLCTILALRSLTAVTVLTVVTTTPALVAIINEKMGRDILGKQFWLGFWLCFAGVILSMPFEHYSGDWLGVMAIIIAVFSSGFYRVKMDEITSKVDAIYVSALCFLILGVLSFAFVPFIGHVSHYDVGYGVVVGICAALANVAFIKSLSLVGATRISVITMIQRPGFILIAALILKEVPTWLQVVGILLVVIGVNFAKVRRAAIPLPSESSAPVQ